MIQVRNVPEELHRKLVRRAEERGLTLTDYIQGVLEREVEVEALSRKGLIKRLRSRSHGMDRDTIVEIIRQNRGELP